MVKLQRDLLGGKTIQTVRTIVISQLASAQSSFSYGQFFLHRHCHHYWTSFTRCTREKENWRQNPLVFLSFLWTKDTNYYAIDCVHSWHCPLGEESGQLAALERYIFKDFWFVQRSVALTPFFSGEEEEKTHEGNWSVYDCVHFSVAALFLIFDLFFSTKETADIKERRDTYLSLPPRVIFFSIWSRLKRI